MKYYYNHYFKVRRLRLYRATNNQPYNYKYREHFQYDICCLLVIHGQSPLFQEWIAEVQIAQPAEQTLVSMWPTIVYLWFEVWRFSRMKFIVFGYDAQIRHGYGKDTP